jgi:hypothetical protein
VRKQLALAAAAVAAAAALGPVGSASAACITVYTPFGPRCVMPCSIVDGVYRTVDGTAGGVLPDVTSNCVQ